MAKISACIISFNEENRIERCLRSLEGVVDEIVVVDSNSTDRTLPIARRYADRVETQEFLGYVGQKAFAFELAENDWILNVDCDEVLSEELRRSIRAEKDALGSHAAYLISRRTFYVYRFIDHGWYPEHRVRLFDRRRCYAGGEEPHERIVVREGRLGRLSGDILHYSFPTLSSHLRTLDNFTEIAALKLADGDRRVTPLTPLLRGSWTFVRLYVLKRGFLDGFAGLCSGLLSGVHVFVKYAKVLTMRRQRAAGIAPADPREREAD